MYQSQTSKDRILHRLKISHGHLKKVIDMAENDQYCIDILHQIQAVQEALKASGNLILENHLRTCASDAIKQGKNTKAIAEIMEVLQKRTI